MSLEQFMASQMRKPSGWFGRVVIKAILNRANIAVVRSTLARLDIQPHHDVLEVGFGGGASLELVLKQLQSGTVTGVDFSPEMVHAAQHRFSQEIASGRVKIMLGNMADLPLASASYDRMFTINTIYFWPDPLQALTEAKRILKPGGLAVIALRSRENMQRVSFVQHGFRLFSPHEVPPLVQQAGFINVSMTHERQGSRFDEVIVSGTAPS